MTIAAALDIVACLALLGAVGVEAASSTKRIYLAGGSVALEQALMQGSGKVSRSLPGLHEQFRANVVWRSVARAPGKSCAPSGPILLEDWHWPCRAWV